MGERDWEISNEWTGQNRDKIFIIIVIIIIIIINIIIIGNFYELLRNKIILKGQGV